MKHSSKKSSPSYKSDNFGGVVGRDADGKLKVSLNDPRGYQHFINTNCKEKDQVTLYITSKRPKRTLAQNRYYQKYLELISLSSGHSKKELHAWAKGKFLTEGISEVFGDKTRVVNSTTDLTIGEFCEFLLRIEEDTDIPLPDSEAFMKALTHAEYDALSENQKAAYSKLKAKIFMK